MAHNPYWPNYVDSDGLFKLGPWFDGFVGEQGKTDDLYTAYTTYGWRRIALSYGAYLSADLTMSASVWIWSPFHWRLLNLGAKKLTINGDLSRLQGFHLGGSGAGIVIGGSARVDLLGVQVNDATGHGFEITSSGNDSCLLNCHAWGNSGDGLRIASGASYVRVEGGTYINNGGYGVNDLDDSSIIVGNRMDGNTSGAINGTPDVDSGNKKT